MSQNKNEMPAAAAKSKTFTVTAAFICAAVAFASCFPIEYLLPKYAGIDPEIPGRFCRLALGFAAFVLLGGKKWLHFDMKGVGIAFLVSLPMWLHDLLPTVPFYVVRFEEGIPPGVWGRVAYCIVLFVCVGFNEEFIFRGLLFGGMLRWIGTKKNGIIISAVVSSLIFGYCHVITTINYSNIYSVLSSLFKTLQTGMFGFVMCYICLKGKQIWGAAILHFFVDFVPRLVIFLEKISTNKVYAHEDRESALSSIQGYSEAMLFYLIPVIYCVIKMRKMKPTDQPFGDEGFEK